MTKNYDLVQDYLKGRFQPSHVVKTGLKGLVMNWEKVVHELVFDGYRYGLRDFVNDLDRRELLDGALRYLAEKSEPIPADLKARTDGADLKFKSASWAADTCLLDEESKAERLSIHGFDLNASWYYFRVPRRHRANFAKDLEGAGITYKKE